MRFTAEALARIAALRRHYNAKGRPEAARNLTKALRQAMQLINAGKGLPAPRPYPELAQPGRAWTHAGCYWIRYATSKPVVILAVFYDEADIPSRLG